MAQEDLIRMYPVKRISAFDGMAVTAGQLYVALQDGTVVCLR